jgi:hypothetical protein
MSAGKIIIIPANLAEPIVMREADEQPLLSELQAIVGGTIEAVPYWTMHGDMPCVTYCNEDGKMFNLPINRRATVLWWHILGGRVDDVLVGDVVSVINLPDKEDIDA